jgi:hypothetical protein
VDWKAPEKIEQVDRSVVANPAQARQLLAAVTYVGRLSGRGARMRAMYACMYYGGLRPSEAIGLRQQDCELPDLCACTGATDRFLHWTADSRTPRLAGMALMAGSPQWPGRGPPDAPAITSAGQIAAPTLPLLRFVGDVHRLPLSRPAGRQSDEAAATVSGAAALWTRTATGRARAGRNRSVVRRVTVTFDVSDGVEYPTWIDGEEGLAWHVEAVIGYWRHPDLGRYRFVPGHRAEAERWHLTVVGPLPGRPSLIGEQEVVLRTFGEGMAWYMDLS